MTEHKITQIEDYDNSGQGQTLFAREHISTLSAQESSKIYELAKMTNNKDIKTAFNTIALDNFQKQVGRYLLDVQALKQDVSWRDRTSDSIYQAVRTIMQHYDGTQPTYDQMIARYEWNIDTQSTYLADRKKTYQAMETFDQNASSQNNNNDVVPTSWAQACAWWSCQTSSNIVDPNIWSIETTTVDIYPIDEQDTTETSNWETLHFRDPNAITEIGWLQERNNFLSTHPNQKIIVYASKPNCSNCRQIAPSFPPSSDQTNTDTVYVHVDFMKMKTRSSNSQNLLNSYGINNDHITGKIMPIIFKIQKDRNTQRKIDTKDFYSVAPAEVNPVLFKNVADDTAHITLEQMLS